MKFTYSPFKDAARIEFIVGDAHKVVEDTHGKTTVRVGVGDSNEADLRKFFSIVRKIARLAHEHKVGAIAFSLRDLRFKKLDAMPDMELGRVLAENLELANYEFRAYKTPPKGGFPELAAVYVEGANADFKKGIAKGQTIAREMNYARDLANTPGGDMTPSLLAEAAKRQLKGTKAKVAILNTPDIKKLKMGLILGVAKGSSAPPKFIVVEYWGAGKGPKQKPVVLVGKGITFDTGGVNLKPSDSLLGMNQDMSGGASVIAALAIAAKLKLKKNVIALVPAVENAVSGSAYLPGDILRAMNGTTVEVLNTDAEGRLVVADALTYAERYEPRLVIDVATLTGAAIGALGKRASAIMTRSSKLEALLRDLGEKSGDYVWPLPLWKEYEADMKGVHADIANIPAMGSPGRSAGGAIQGGIFLSHFASKFPLFAHIDMAPRMESIPEDNLGKGAAGAPIRLLVRVIEEF